MALIFRLIRLLLPLILMFLFYRFIRNLLYTMGRGSYSYPGSSSSGAGQQRSSSHNTAGRSDPYNVLGCSRNATNEEIRSCYRKLVAKYHPDKFIGQELDEEFIELATRRFKEIQNAYEEIRRMRGMN